MRTESIDNSSIARFLAPRGQTDSVRNAAELLAKVSDSRAASATPPAAAPTASTAGRQALFDAAPRKAGSAALLARLAQSPRPEIALSRNADQAARPGIEVQTPASPSPATAAEAPAPAEPAAGASGIVYNDQAIAALAVAFGTSAGDQGYIPTLDTDANGVLDFVDLNYMLSNYQPAPQ